MFKKVFITLVSLSTFSYFHFSESEKKEIPQESFSTYRAALEVNREIASTSPLDKIMPVSKNTLSLIKKNKEIDLENISSDDLHKSYFKDLQQPAQELADNLDYLEEKHRALLNKMREEGVKIDPVSNIKPRLLIAISYNLGLNISSINSDDLAAIEFSSREWYLIKTFSESNDFRIMLKRDILTYDDIQISNLHKRFAVAQ